ncbi:C-1-tetrahydrofolate synthase, cytoplasmic isoform 2-T3 [Polymixia lowei]
MLSFSSLTLRFGASGCRSGRRTVATVVSGNKTSQLVRQRLKKEVEKMRTQFPGFRPGLVVLQVGDRDDSNLYISMKLKAAAEIGINANHIRLPRTATEDEVMQSIVSVNENPSVHGLIVQLPLDSVHRMDTERVTNAVSPHKDVDGLTSINAGKLSRGDLADCYIPCTPNGCMELISQTGVSVAGKHAVVIGRSKIVGAPMHDLLLWNHATVTNCHSKTQDLPQQVGRADILVVGAGKAEMVRGEWVKEGAVVIDCGINHIPDETKANGKRVVGDVHYPSANQRAGFITPVPGGVGPMTVAMLMENTVQSAWRFLKRNQAGRWNISYTKLTPQNLQPSNATISQSCRPKAISRLVREVGLFSEEAEPYGGFRAKVSPAVLQRLREQPDGKYVVVTGITPGPEGEGRTTTTLGLAQALGAHLNINCLACIPQHTHIYCSGTRGLAVGGGYSQVFPIEEVCLQLSGESQAVRAASELVVQAVQSRLLAEAAQSQQTLFERLVPLKNGQRIFSQSQINRLKKVGIEKSDPATLTAEDILQFVDLDIDPQINLESLSKAVSSELIAILALSRGPQDMEDRLARMVVTTSRRGTAITTDQLDISRVLSVLLRQAAKPNLMQTLEGSPVLLHNSVMSDMAHSCSSVLADQIALKLVGPQGIVVTDAGGSADIGLEKFLNIKCRRAGLQPDVVVMVATVAGLRMHGGGAKSPASLENGCRHLRKQVENVRAFGLPVVVAVNVFSRDTAAELELVCSQAMLAGAADAMPCSHWAEGGAGALALGQAVQRAAETPHQLNFLYDLEAPIVEKIRTLAQKLYGAEDVQLQPEAQQKVALFTELGLASLPVCMVKTPLSLSHDPERKGVPSGFILPIRDIEASLGAGYLSPLVATPTATLHAPPGNACLYDNDL